MRLLGEELYICLTEYFEAYAVNFNMALSSFEPNILSLRRMIDLALASPRASPPRLMFTSSMSTLRSKYSGENLRFHTGILLTFL